MTVLSDYMSGTISLANGSVTVTGTGTLFEATKFKEGDTLQIQNLTAVIASVDSDTQLTLAEPWTGVDIIDGAYRARQLGDGTRVSTQAATVIQTLGNGVLANLAELGVEEGKVPVGGPTGEYELADLVADPNGSLEKLAALTLAANKILNTDGSGNLTQSDITAAALVLLKLAGTAAEDKLPYFDASNSSALADFTAAARALTNLSGTPAANMLPYLTGASGAGLTALTAFARTILDDTSGAAMFATLGAISGTNWWKLPNGLLFQRGSTQVTTDASGNATLTFPTAFSANDSFQVMAWNDNKDAWAATLMSHYRSSSPWPRTTGCVIGCWNTLTGAALASQSIRIGWQAFGS